MSQMSLADFVKRAAAGSKTEIVLAIVLRSDGRHIGNVSLQSINWVHRSGELAIILGAKDCWGQGYGEEASRTMVDYAFNRLGLRRITCGTFVGNVGMQRIAQKLGFREEGVRRLAVYKDGSHRDVVEYGLFLEEFTGAGK